MEIIISLYLLYVIENLGFYKIILRFSFGTIYGDETMMEEKERADLEMEINFNEKGVNDKWQGYIWIIFGFAVVIFAAIFNNIIIAVLGIALVIVGAFNIFRSDYAKAKLPSLRRQLETAEEQPTNQVAAPSITNEVRYCKYCGQSTSVGAMFCEKCGKKQSPDEEPCGG